MYCRFCNPAAKLFAAAIACLAVLSVTSSSVTAEVTAKSILDKEIEEFGPKYQGVEDPIQKLREGDAKTARAMLDKA